MMSEIKIVTDQMEAVLKRFPKLRRETVENVTQKVKTQLDAEIASRLHDTHGKVRGWQVIRIGSKGGYGAISPSNGGSGKNSPGAITRYLEVGHQIRKPKNPGQKGYRSRAKMVAVQGRWFYRSTDAQKDNIINAAIERLEEEITKLLEGK